VETPENRKREKNKMEMNDAVDAAWWRFIDFVVAHGQSSSDSDPIVAACEHAKGRHDAVNMVARYLMPWGTLSDDHEDERSDDDRTYDVDDAMERALLARLLRVVESDTEMSKPSRRLACISIQALFTNLRSLSIIATDAESVLDAINELPIVFPHIVKRGKTGTFDPAIALRHILSATGFAAWDHDAPRDEEIFAVRPRDIRRGAFFDVARRHGIGLLDIGDGIIDLAVAGQVEEAWFINRFWNPPDYYDHIEGTDRERLAFWRLPIPPQISADVHYLTLWPQIKHISGVLNTPDEPTSLARTRAT
jgi:hypothetical protein